MLINLTDIFSSEGKVRNESLVYEQDEVFYMGCSYPIIEKSSLELSLSNIGTGKIYIKGQMKLIFEMPCDRCLTKVRETMIIEIENELLSPEAIARVEDDNMETQEYLEGYVLNTDALVNNEILINMPVKVLCNPECKGICKQCGQNLNEGDCGCDTFVPDPRMAAIKDIFNANKEV